MAMSVLKDVLISTNKLENYFSDCVPVNLWRAMKRQKSGMQRTAPQQVFHFIEEDCMLSNGRARPADIKIELRNGCKWVSVKDRPRGVSTFDKAGAPPGDGWIYLLIPQGTILPPGLAIVKDEFNSRFGATHYTIAPTHDMPLAEFKNLLELLALTILKEVA